MLDVLRLFNINMRKLVKENISNLYFKNVHNHLTFS